MEADLPVPPRQFDDESAMDDTILTMATGDLQGIHIIEEQGTEQPEEVTEYYEEEEYYPDEEVQQTPTHQLFRAPSQSLLSPTQARINERETAERDKHKNEVFTRPILKEKFVPASEALLKTTQARISEMRDREERRGTIKDKDDPWWDKRRPVEREKYKAKIDVPSKLHETTAAYVNSTRKKASVTPTKKKTSSTIKIDSESPLLRPTTNSQGKSWGNSPPPPPPATLDLCANSSGPQHVHSKLMEQTTAAKAMKYKSKEELRKEEQKAKRESTSKTKEKVSAPSERLVAFNSNMRRQSRDKVHQSEVDPREKGWELFTSKERALSGGSPKKTDQQSNSSANGDAIAPASNADKRSGSFTLPAVSEHDESSGGPAVESKGSASPTNAIAKARLNH